MVINSIKFVNLNKWPPLFGLTVVGASVVGVSVVGASVVGASVVGAVSSPTHISTKLSSV